uniref:Uncharacterized protein n=1 Tax=Oryza nivara TaxID=4536 RepID=A0A0E0IQC8_ORYNI
MAFINAPLWPVSISLPGALLPPLRPIKGSPNPLLSPHTLPVLLSLSTAAALFSSYAAAVAQLRPPLAGGRNLLGARRRRHLLRRFLLLPVHSSVEYKDHGNDDNTDDPKLLVVSPSSPASPSSSRRRVRSVRTVTSSPFPPPRRWPSPASRQFLVPLLPGCACAPVRRELPSCARLTMDRAAGKWDPLVDPVHVYA